MATWNQCSATQHHLLISGLPSCPSNMIRIMLTGPEFLISGHKLHFFRRFIAGATNDKLSGKGEGVLTLSTTDQSSMAKPSPQWPTTMTQLNPVPPMIMPGLLKSMQDPAISDVLSNPTVVWARPLRIQAVDGDIPDSAVPDW